MDPGEGRRVMVAVDEGDESARALRWCLANFAARGDTIVLLYVRAPPPTYSVLDATGPVGYMFAGEATAAVEGYSRQVADAVVEKAKNLKRALLGSVSDYCVRNANCPVLIVKS